MITPIMMTSSNGNIFRVTGPLCGEFTGPGEFPTQRPVTRSIDVFCDLRLDKRMSKQPWGWWFETPSWSLWRLCNDDNEVTLKGMSKPSHRSTKSWYNNNNKTKHSEKVCTFRWIYSIFLNTLRPRQNCHHFADDIFKCMFLDDREWISLKISLKLFPKIWINNIPALVEATSHYLKQWWLVSWSIHAPLYLRG